MNVSREASSYFWIQIRGWHLHSRPTAWLLWLVPGRCRFRTYIGPNHPRGSLKGLVESNALITYPAYLISGETSFNVLFVFAWHIRLGVP